MFLLTAALLATAAAQTSSRQNMANIAFKGTLEGVGSFPVGYFPFPGMQYTPMPPNARPIPRPPQPRVAPPPPQPPPPPVPQPTPAIQSSPMAPPPPLPTPPASTNPEILQVANSKNNANADPNSNKIMQMANSNGKGGISQIANSGDADMAEMMGWMNMFNNPSPQPVRPRPPIPQVRPPVVQSPAPAPPTDNDDDDEEDDME